MIVPSETAGVLYHYTSQKSLRAIVDDRRLKVSSVYYMNDANEIKYAARLLKGRISSRRDREVNGAVIDFLAELSDRIEQLIGNPHTIFVFSLTEKGNLLSQWRGYTPRAEAGVSIGFSKSGLEGIASQNGFELVRCLYDPDEQAQALNSELDAIIAKFVVDAPSISTAGRPQNQRYLLYLNQYVERLLKACCRIKDPYFLEEVEWRLVSKYYESYRVPDIKFDERRTTLIPFVELPLEGIHGDGRLFEEVFVGPSPNPTLAFAAIATFLSNRGVCHVTRNSLSPERQL